MRIAGIQFISGDQPMKNIDRALDFAIRAVQRGAKVVTFHQLFHAPWFLHEESPENFKWALTMDSDEIHVLRDAAKELQVTLICPIFEQTERNTFANTVLIIDERGNIRGRYRKTHVPSFENYLERYYFTPGNELPVITLNGLKVGFAICWENFFPEVHRTLALKGVDLIIAPTAAGKRSNDRWLVTMASQAITNCTYILRVNRAGEEAGLHFYGDTFCANPVGELLYEPTGQKSAVYLVDIDRKLLDETREIFGVEQYRRPELYGLLTEPVAAAGPVAVPQLDASGMA